MVKIINLYGSPGCGKSTTATSLFSKMKMMDISVEITLEYVKKYAWKKIPIGKYDQYYIFGKQLQSVTTLLDKVFKYLSPNDKI
jgi:adenylate kinase family enzyme